MSWAEFIFWVSAFLIFHTYIGYPLVLVALSVFFAKQRTYDENHLPTVSMIFAAYNEDSIIKDKLENCQTLDYPAEKLEILIGSDGCTDRTNEIAHNYVNDRIRLKAFTQRRGKAAVLNDLAGAARGEILVFSDANSMYKSDAIRRLVGFFADKEVGGVCGRLVLLSHGGKLEADGERLYWDYENYLKYLEGRIKTVIGANGAIYAIRRELFRALPTQEIITDDFVIALRVVQAGQDVIYEKDAVAWEYTSPNVRAEFKRKKRIGAANYFSIRHVFSLLNPSKGFVAFGLWSHKVIRWIAPFLLLAIFTANLFLLNQTHYRFIFLMQTIFYSIALVAWIFDRLGKPIRWLVYPYYFVMANLALLVGFFKFVMNSEKPAWTRVER